MRQHLWKGMVVVLVVVGLVSAAQPAFAWMRVGINIGVPFPLFVAPVARVVAAPAVYAPSAPAYYQPAVHPRHVWVPGHFNRWGAWIPGHWR